MLDQTKKMMIGERYMDGYILYQRERPMTDDECSAFRFGYTEGYEMGKMEAQKQYVKDKIQ